MLRLGIGDVTLPLCDAVIQALHQAVDDQATNRPSMAICLNAAPPSFLKPSSNIMPNVRSIWIPVRSLFPVVPVMNSEIFLDLFAEENTALVIEPAYPAYVDANIMANHPLIHLNSSQENGFTPLPDDSLEADIIYLCSPNNPTGAVFSHEKLKAWVDYANQHHSLILFDAAYEAFIEEENVPHCIFEIEGSRTCAIEICSLSKNGWIYRDALRLYDHS